MKWDKKILSSNEILFLKTVLYKTIKLKKKLFLSTLVIINLTLSNFNFNVNTTI